MRDVAQHAGSLPVGVRVVESVPAPVGRVTYEAVDSHVYLRAKPDSITVGRHVVTQRTPGALAHINSLSLPLR